jgi:hypothetical protein
VPSSALEHLQQLDAEYQVDHSPKPRPWMMPPAASDERLAEASTASLAIVAIGLLPLIALSRQISARCRQE